MNKTPKITPVGLFATPESIEFFQEYLSRFNGSEGAVAQTAAWMAWNLAESHTRPPEGSIDVRMTIPEADTICRALSNAINVSCDAHKEILTTLHKELNKALENESNKD